MADYGAKFADKKIRKVDRQLQAEYRQAEIELKKKLADFVRRSKAQDIYKRKQVQAGIITEKEYQSWLKGQVFQKERWEAKVRQIEKIMHNHNEVAARIVHENKLDVYDENYLRQSWEMNGITGYSFDFSNEQTISNLIKNRDKLLPEWKIDEEKDYKWNYQKANNAITQGIIQGESVEKVMKRLAENLCTQNENKMRMFARTAINAAQSAGRQQQMADAEKEFGIKQLKQWLATLDMRTRDAHRHLDGDEVGIHESFKSDLGEIRFPGDPEAEPANVYNCRCTIITIYPEYRTEQDNWRENETIGGQTYEEWKQPIIKAMRISEDEIQKENELIAIQELAEKYGINGNVEDKETLAKIADSVISDSGYDLPKSRWNGKVQCNNKIGNIGEYDFETNTVILWKDADFATTIHELIHSRSFGTTEELYKKYKRIEEACVETITRSIASRYAVNQSKAYPTWVNAFRQIAELTEMTPDEYAIDLLKMPLNKREEALRKTVNAYINRNKSDHLEQHLLSNRLLKLGVKLNDTK